MNSFYYEQGQELLQKMREESTRSALENIKYHSYTESTSVTIKKPSFFRKFKRKMFKIKPVFASTPMTDMANPEVPYTKTYTSFSGADCCVIVGEDIVGDLTNVLWYIMSPSIQFAMAKNSDYVDSYMINEFPVIVAAKFVYFQDEPFKGLEDKEVDIELRFADEYGHRANKKINGAKLLYKQGDIGIDSICMNGYSIFAARGITDLIETK